MSRTIIVTRHSGAVDLLRELGVEGEVVETLSPETIAELTPDDRVYGPLPVRLIAALTARGVPYYAVDMGLDAAQRGRELGSAEMRAAGATTQRYAVFPISALPETLGRPSGASPDRSRVLTRLRRTISGRLKVKAVIAAFAVTAALRLATIVVDAFWQGAKDIVDVVTSDPAEALLALERVLAGQLDGQVLARSALEAGIAFIGFLGALAIARHFAGRVLHTTFLAQPVEPRAVLIQGLSPLLRDPGAAEPFREIDLRFSGLSRPALDIVRAQIQERLAATPGDTGLQTSLDQIARLPTFVPWQQNLRAILSHAPKLQRIYVIPAQLAPPGDGSAQAAAFLHLLRDILQRSGHGHVTVALAPGKPIHYEDHDQALGAIGAAIRAARADGFDEADIAIDGTAGTKVFSIAAAVATINSRALLTYVNNDGETLIYDGRMSLAEAEAS